MIDRDYCVMMARYNAWQNRQLEGFLQDLPLAELTRDRKAFFGSILATLNHLYWGDWIWMSRFDGGEPPPYSIADHTGMFPTLAAWSAARFRMDGRIRLWAENLHNLDLAGNFNWASQAAKREVSVPMAQAVVHFFNHQTHHRGQVHAMLTATGSAAPVSDLFLMPDDI